MSATSVSSSPKNSNVRIHPSWKAQLENEFSKPYFTELTNKVRQEYLTQQIFPSPENLFRAFDLVPFEEVKVVILGQDPYHTPNVADGLAFSTKPGNVVPPSLQNIYKEIASEFNYGSNSESSLSGQPSLSLGLSSYPNYKNPDLTRWAEQGVFLLNNTLTVRAGQANSHAKFGWDTFTNAVISLLAEKKSNLVFMLWGNFARSKKSLILEASGGAGTNTDLGMKNNDNISLYEVIENDPKNQGNEQQKQVKRKISEGHLILESAHPSPLSAHNGFFGNKHFVQCNQYLNNNGLGEIAG